MNVSPSALALISRPVFRPEMLPPTRCVLSKQFPVNLASRLTDRARSGEVLLSSAVYRALRDRPVPDGGLI